MSRKRPKPERLSQAAAGGRAGRPRPERGVAEAIRAIGVSEVTYYRWRREYGGLNRIRSGG